MRPIITINQESDTPARREVAPGAVLTYLYDRSRDSKQANAPGQDFIAFCYDANRIAFAVCDGVSQSFFGDLAARFLGERLVGWLSALELELNSSYAALTDDFAGLVDRVLRAWPLDAQPLVAGRQISAHVPPMVREALERKRENGSEAMFAAGLVDRAHGLLALCWMGDVRLRLWDARGGPIALPGATWKTRERWSTRVGPKNGGPHSIVVPLGEVARITAHTDGIGSRDSALDTLALDRLDALARELAAAPASDDVAVLDIDLLGAAGAASSLAAPVLYLPDPHEPVITWQAVPGAEWYRARIDAGAKCWTVDLTHAALIVPSEVGGRLTVSVQALASDRIPGEWSDPLELDLSAIRAAQEQSAELAASAVLAEQAAAPAQPVGVPMPTMHRSAQFHIGLVMALSILLALMLAVGWYLLYFRI